MITALHWSLTVGLILIDTVYCVSSCSQLMIFVLSSLLQEHPSRDFSLRASYIEIYKEELRDLLDWETSSKDLNIREDEKGNTGKTVIVQLMKGQHCGDSDSTVHANGSTGKSVFTKFLQIQKFSSSEKISSLGPKTCRNVELFRNSRKTEVCFRNKYCFLLYISFTFLIICHLRAHHVVHLSGFKVTAFQVISVEVMQKPWNSTNMCFKQIWRYSINILPHYYTELPFTLKYLRSWGIL